MSENNPLRIGFIGAGNICRSRHLPGLAKIEGVEVVAVANRTMESGRAIAKDFNIPDVTDDWRELIARDDLDAIFIGTWPYTHKDMSIATLEAGKHVLCEARMAMNLDEAKAMLEAANAHPQLVNMICPPPTRMPFESWIRSTIDSGRLGAITLVRLLSANGGNLDPNKFSWREDVTLSGRQILGMGIFAETLNAFVGDYESLRAETSITVTPKNVDGKKVDVKIPQTVTINGKLKGGALILEHHTGLAADKSTAGNELVIQGLKGTLRYRFGNTIEFAEAGEELKEVDVPADEQRDWHVEEDFIAAVRAANAGKSWNVSPDFAEGLRYMQKVEAVHLSAETGKAVQPDSL